MKKLVLMIVALMFSMSVHAETAKRTSIEQLVELTESAKLLDSMYGQLESMFSEMAVQLRISEEERPIFDRHMSGMTQIFREEMSWDKMKEPLIAIYMNSFSEEEVQGMITFYSSDVGKSMIRKMPLVMRNSMTIGQDLMKSAMPRLEVLNKQLIAELEAARSAKK